MRKKKILVVDDEKNFTDMVKLNLELSGQFQVLVENDPTQAVQVASVFRPDLILLDVIMPHIEGPDVLFVLRQNDLTTAIPVVFLTATVTRDEVQAGQGKIGGHSFLPKPCSLSELMKCIEDELGNIPS